MKCYFLGVTFKAASFRIMSVELLKSITVEKLIMNVSLAKCNNCNCNFQENNPSKVFLSLTLGILTLILGVFLTIAFTILSVQITIITVAHSFLFNLE